MILARVVALIVCATIVRGNKVLLVRHAAANKPDYGDWLLPAGSVEPCETLEEALSREICEETSLSIKIVKKLVEHVDLYTHDKLVNFLCRPLTSKIKTSSELAEARWIGVDEIHKLDNIHDGLKQFLINGFKNGILKECPAARASKSARIQPKRVVGL